MTQAESTGTPETTMTDSADHALGGVPDDVLEAEVRRRRAAADERRAHALRAHIRSGADLANAVRGFLTIPLFKRAVDAGPDWADEWLTTGVNQGVRVGDVLALDCALRLWDDAHVDDDRGSNGTGLVRQVAPPSSL